MITQKDIDDVQDALESIPTDLEDDRRNSRVLNALRSTLIVGAPPVPPHHGDDRARVLAAIAPRVGQLRAQATLHPDAHVDVGLVRETIALLQSLLPANPSADKQAQVDMATDHNGRADAAENDQANDLAAIRRALFSGQKSATKSAAQEAFLRVAKKHHRHRSAKALTNEERP